MLSSHTRLCYDFLMGQEKNSYVSFFVFLSVALSSVLFQTLTLSLLQLTIAQVNGVIAWILGALYLGIVTGESRFLNSRISRAILISSALFCFAVGLFFSRIVELAIASFPFKFFVVGGTLLSALAIGVLLTRSVFFSKKVLRNYAGLNLASALCVIASILILPLIGLNTAFVVLAVLLGLNAGFKLSTDAVETIRNLGTDWYSAALGVVSASYVAITLEFRSLSIYPSGLEMESYLLCVFIALTIAPGAAKFISSRVPFDSSKAVLTGAILFTLTVASLTVQTSSGSFLFGSPKSGAYRQIAALFKYSFILFAPYIFFAMLLPLRVLESKNRNQLFSISLGNFLGFFLFSLLLRDYDLNNKLLTFSILAVLIILLKQRKVTLGLIFFLFLNFAFIPKNLDERILLQPRTISAGSPVVPPAAPKILSLTRRDGDLGYLLDFAGGWRFLGLGGYISRTNQLFDLIRARVAAQFLSKVRQPVLVLGLGNMQVISALRAKDPLAEIDVVDNFGPFKSREFRAAINPDQADFPKNVRLIHSDALPFLRLAPKKYGLIVWNLSWPIFPSSRKMFTSETMQIIANTLSLDGIFVSENLGTPEIDCLVVNAFANTYRYPRKANHPVAVLVAAHKHLVLPDRDLTYPKNACDKIRTPTYANPFVLGLNSYQFGFDYGRLRVEPKGWDKRDVLPTEYVDQLSYVSSRLGSPFYLVLAGQSRSPVASTLNNQNLGYYTLALPDSAPKEGVFREAVTAAQHFFQLKIVTDLFHGDLPQLQKTGISSERFISIWGSDEKGISPAIDLRPALTAIAKHIGSRPPSINLLSRLNGSESLYLGFKVQITHWMKENVAEGSSLPWEIEMAQEEKGWPKSENRIFIRLLFDPKAKIVPPIHPNQILVPIADPNLSNCGVVGEYIRKQSSKSMDPAAWVLLAAINKKQTNQAKSPIFFRGQQSMGADYLVPCRP